MNDYTDNPRRNPETEPCPECHGAGEDGQPLHHARAVAILCADCGINTVEKAGSICEGCSAYQEHTNVY